MSLLSSQVAEYVAKGSAIRKMFDAGIELRKKYGADAVCDFSLGNPDMPPPVAISEELIRLGKETAHACTLGYMPNAGFPWARQKLAAHLSQEQGIHLEENDVLLSCGAAGAMNAFLRAVLEPGDEVLGMAPHFVEYGFYTANHGGVFRSVPTVKETFALDPAAIEAALNPRTRAVIINNPNNPTGTVYSKAELEAVCAVLEAASRKYGRPIYLISDEPYRFLTYDGVEVPAVLPLYQYCVIASSFSKNLSLAGERIGYLALSPLLEERAQLMSALILTNRILGYVNPPVVGQYLMVAGLGSQVDTAVYAARRQAMAEVLADAGFEFNMPKGAFYFFPKAPGGDANILADRLKELCILIVPGDGFAAPGYFRAAFCVDEQIIRKAAQGFKKARG